MNLLYDSTAVLSGYWPLRSCILTGVPQNLFPCIRAWAAPRLRGERAHTARLNPAELDRTLLRLSSCVRFTTVERAGIGHAELPAADIPPMRFAKKWQSSQTDIANPLPLLVRDA